MCSRQIRRNPNFRISKKKPIGKEKVTNTRRGYTKFGCAIPYRWGYDDSIYRISRGILKLAKVVGTGLNQKAISGGMGKVVKVVGAGGNRKPISGVMGRVFCFI